MKIRFSGLGGQGVVISGVIYGHAAMLDGRNVLQRQSYGSTTRGGVTTSDVTIEDGEICELEGHSFDVVVALCQEAYDRFWSMAKDDGVVITESSMVESDAGSTGNIKHLPIAAVDTARTELGRQILANIVTLGALFEAAPGLSEDAVKRAIEANVPQGTSQINLKAFAVGRHLARQEQ